MSSRKYYAQVLLNRFTNYAEQVGTSFTFHKFSKLSNKKNPFRITFDPCWSKSSRWQRTEHFTFIYILASTRSYLNGKKNQKKNIKKEEEKEEEEVEEEKDMEELRIRG